MAEHLNGDVQMRHIHMFGSLKKALRTTDFGRPKMSRLQWCSGSSSSHPRSSLQTGSISWCINGFTASAPMETIFNGLYSFAQNNPQMCFILMTLTYHTDGSCWWQWNVLLLFRTFWEISQSQHELHVKLRLLRTGMYQATPSVYPKHQFSTAPPFLTSALDGGEWSAPCPCHFTPRETARTHCIGSWVGRRGGLDFKEKGNISFPYWESNPDSSVVQPVVQTLFWLSYPGSKGLQYAFILWI
jgi:hypothetical protein